MKNLSHVYSFFDYLGALLHELNINTLEVLLHCVNQVSQSFEQLGGFFMALLDDRIAPFHIFLLHVQDIVTQVLHQFFSQEFHHSILLNIIHLCEDCYPLNPFFFPGDCFQFKLFTHGFNILINFNQITNLI